LPVSDDLALNACKEFDRYSAAAADLNDTVLDGTNVLMVLTSNINSGFDQSWLLDEQIKLL
jgi:hypothetical protein